jgi:GNAT superfamily N-acetyltransferase
MSRMRRCSSPNGTTRCSTILYATIEPATWSDLRPETGFIHDVAVVQSRRGAGIAATLVSAALAWFRDRGSPHVMLTTAERNRGAQDFFSRLGFRRTMVEMAREL